MFSPLPGIGRVKYCLLQMVVDQIFTSGGVDLHARLFIDHHCISCFFFTCLIWPQLRNYITCNSEIFPIYGIWLYAYIPNTQTSGMLRGILAYSQSVYIQHDCEWQVKFKQ